jgi:hypothetical protein
MFDKVTSAIDEYVEEPNNIDRELDHALIHLNTMLKKIEKIINTYSYAEMKESIENAILTDGQRKQLLSLLAAIEEFKNNQGGI